MKRDRILLTVIVLMLTAGMVSASGVLSSEEAGAVTGGCPYAACVKNGFCNAQPTAVEQGKRCDNTCSASSQNRGCVGYSTHQQCYWDIHDADCGYKYDSGISREGVCKHDKLSNMTDIECAREDCHY